MTRHTRGARIRKAVVECLPPLVLPVSVGSTSCQNEGNGWHYISVRAIPVLLPVPRLNHKQNLFGSTVKRKATSTILSLNSGRQFPRMMSPIMERERLQAMLDAGKRKLFDVLIVSEIRAISRRQVEVLVIYDILQKYGIRLETVKEKFGEDAMSKAILSHRAVFVEVEVEQARMRMARGKKDRILIGQAPVTVTPCYTHKLVDTKEEIKGQFVLNTEVVYKDAKGKKWTRIDVARFFCDILAKGGSLRKVCLTLNDMGIPSAKGKLWQPQTVRGIVNNPILYGQPYANRYMPVKKKTLENGKYSHHEKIRPVEEWIPLPPCEPVITKETWELIQFQIERNKAESMRNNELEEPGLVRAGYIFCGVCGGLVWPHPPSPSSRYSGNFYECLN